MTFFNTLLVSVLLDSFSVGYNQSGLDGQCENLEVETKFNQDQNGKFRLTITPKGGNAPYVIFLWKDNEELLDYDGKVSEYKNLQAGKYTCVVGDANRCGKKLELTIE